MMGDRVSIQFQNGDDKSVVLFSHWGGMQEVALAKQYVKELKYEFKGSTMWPLERMETGTVMIDYIVRYVSKMVQKNGHIMSSYYLAASPAEGDNSDNGHWIIDLQTGEAISESGARL
jgi:hypothetical protein